jgi:uncharacterized membrane protein
VSTSGTAAEMETLLQDLGAETELVEHEVFDGTRKVVAHLRRRPSVVRNVNQEAHDRLTLMDRLAVVITDRVGTFGFFLIIFAWTVFWLGWNTFGPPRLRFDPGPAFVFWLFISNMIQIFLMPLLMVGQNLQGRHSELRAEADFEVNTKAEQEVEAILLHLEQQAAQIERQGELILEVLHRLEDHIALHAGRAESAAAASGAGPGEAAMAAVSVGTASAS